MSYTNYEKAVDLAKQCKSYQCAGIQTDELIEKVEETLKVSLSKQHKHYFKNYGYIFYFGSDFYGIYPDVFNGIYYGNAIIATLQDRNDYNLPISWIPISDFDDGYVAYLDYDHLNSDGEPRVIEGMYTGNTYEVTKVLAEDLGDFLLEDVERQLANQ